MDLDAEKNRVLERDAEWSKLASEGRDIETIISYRTDDAVVIPPGMPAVIGKEALRQYIETCIEGRAVTLWRPKANGEWRCGIDIWNSE